MPAKLVNASGKTCVQFACDHCGKNLIAGLDGLGGLFKCPDCDHSVQMPSVPCQYRGCSGFVRRCNGVLQVRPESEAELHQAREAADREIATLEGAAPTDSYLEDVRDIRHAAESSVMRYRCSGCGALRSMAYHQGDRCTLVVCSVCHREPDRDELPEPDSIFNQALEATYPYLWLDTADVKVRRSVIDGGQFDHYETVIEQVIVAVGAELSGERHVLACALPQQRAQAFWTGLLRGLTSRGLSKVGLVIADEGEQLKAAIDELLPGTPLQRCRTGFLQQVTAELPRADRARARSAVKDIFASPDRTAALARLVVVANELEAVSRSAAEMLRANAGELLAYMEFPRRHQARISSLDGLKQLNENISGERLYADDAAALSWAKRACVEVDREWRTEGAYLSPTRLHSAA